MCDAGPDDARLLPKSLAGTAQLFSGFSEVGTADVAQLDMLQVPLAKGVGSIHARKVRLPLVIGYEIEVSEDHRGRDVEIIPTVCVLGETGIDLCEDAGYFHPDQLRTWLAQAEGDYNRLLADDSEPVDYADPWAASAAEDRWIAQRDQVHYSCTGL